MEGMLWVCGVVIVLAVVLGGVSVLNQFDRYVEKKVEEKTKEKE